MKTWLIYILLLAGTGGIAQNVPLEIRITHQGAGSSYMFNRLAHATTAGTPFQVTRLAYFISQPRLQKADGSWVTFKDHYTLVEAHEGDTSLVFNEVPTGNYQAIEWQLGVPADVNHSDPSEWPAAHALNPAINNLHWTWQSGYIFLALEGKYRDPKGQQPGFVYHVANEAQLRTVRIHCNMNLKQSTVAQVVMEVPRLFEDLDMVRDGSSTHSRKGDPIAPALADRASRSFSLRSSADGAVQTTVHFPGAIYPPGTTPVKLALGKGIPQPNLPLDNPLTKEGIALGKKLFVEKKLSRGEGQHCLSCHYPDTAFSDAGNALSIGVTDKEGLKNSMALFNLAWQDRFFWDGRAPSLRAQVLHPIQDPLELNETLENVEAKLQTAEYTNLFQKAFASPEVTIEKMALALEQYLFSIVSFDSSFDRSNQGQGVLTDAEKRGRHLFLTEFDPARGQRGADCFHCHGGYLFTNNRFFNNGLDEKPERGYAIVTNNLKDWGKFKVPSLRNVAVTGPYMHDGRFETLEEVVEHYNRGVKRTPTLDANLAKHPATGLDLSDQEKADLLAFLRSLTDFEYRD